MPMKLWLLRNTMRERILPCLIVSPKICKSQEKSSFAAGNLGLRERLTPLYGRKSQAVKE